MPLNDAELQELAQRVLEFEALHRNLQKKIRSDSLLLAANAALLVFQVSRMTFLKGSFTPMHAIVALIIVATAIMAGKMLGRYRNRTGLSAEMGSTLQRAKQVSNSTQTPFDPAI